jgi:hypothetical protein
MTSLNEKASISQLQEKQILEIMMTHEEIINSFIKTTALFTKLHITSLPSDKIQKDDGRCAVATLQIIKNNGSSLSIDTTDDEYIVDLLTEKQQVFTVPTTYPTLVDCEQHELSAFYMLFYNTFIHPLDVYDKRVTQELLDLKITKIAKLHLTEAATEKTSMVVDTEASATPETLKSLIASEVAKATKAQTKEIAQLQKQLKNYSRGAATTTTTTTNTTSASSKKKLTLALKKDDKNKKKNAPTTAASNNATTAAKRISWHDKKGKKSSSTRKGNKNA